MTASYSSCNVSNVVARNAVLVYHDEGVSDEAYHQLFRSLKDELPSYFQLITVNHRDLTEQSWEQHTVLVVIPGGRDKPYHDRLSGLANVRIKQYVENGGAYLGVCAGGYYGSGQIEFDKNGQYEICEPRELAFFPGKAVGPAYTESNFRYNSEEGSVIAQVQWKKGSCQLYFNGGCFFENPEKYKNVEVVARYEDLPNQPAAVVSCTVGSGKALLAGVHPEYTSIGLRRYMKKKPKLYSSLSEAENQRKAFWSHLVHIAIT